MAVINTNVMSLNSQRALVNSQSSMKTSLERLSSGLRINSAKDDAAGLAIGERFTAQIRGLEQANRNANDGISMLQTAEGAMDEIGNMLQRMRELAVQSNNASVGTSDKQSLNKEYVQLQEEITRITQATEFNGVSLLGNDASLSFQVGFKAGAQYKIGISTVDIAATGANGIGSVLGTTTSDIATATTASAAMAQLDTAIDRITQKRADFGSKMNRLESTVRNNSNIIENQSAARSRIQDADFARETANLTRTQILQQAGTAMLSQANQVPQGVLSLLR